jgi:hypothetical protein
MKLNLVHCHFSFEWLVRSRMYLTLRPARDRSYAYLSWWYYCVQKARL